MVPEAPMCLFLVTCSLLASRMSVDASFTLGPSDGFVSRGVNYTFTLRLSQPDIRTGKLVIFKRRADHAVNVCDLNITTGEMFTVPGPEYDCGRGQEDGSYYLHISGVSKNDAGTWYCQHGTTFSNNVSLDVKYPPTVKIKPVAPCKGFTYSLKDRNVSLTCTVTSANPTPTTFQWYQNKTPIGKGQMYLITRVWRSSEGLYRCEAENGEAQHGEDAVTVNVTYPPVVEVPRNSFIVNESRDLDIPCTADANPNITSIVWTKEGVNARIRENESVLKLRNVTKTDNGTYICKAENSITRCDGSNSTESRTVEAKVEVQYKPVIQSFRILDNADQKDVTVKEHTMVNFTCEVDSFPGADINIGKERRLVNQTQKGVTLSHVIRSAQCQDRGNFTCSARNILGEVKSDKMQLLINCSPRPANGSSEGMVLAKAVNHNVTINLKVIAYPKPVFTLRENETAKHVASDTNPIWDGLMATGSITLYNIQSEQFGSYILRVNNTEGELDYKIDLRSKSEPEQPVRLEVYNVKTRSLSLSWEKGFNGGAVQNFTVEYKRNGGQWIKHPDILSEQDDLQLDLAGLEPSTDYEIRLKAQNKYGSSEYIYINAKTSSDVSYAPYVGLGGAVIFVIVVIVVVVIVLKKRRKHGLKDTGTSRSRAGDADVLVMEDNVMYAGCTDISTSGERRHNSGDVYAVVQKPSTANVAPEDEYSLPQKEKRKPKVTEADEVYANTGGNAVEEKAVPKTGRDVDGLLYVSVDFDKEPTSDVIIGADVDAGQYSAIDFLSLGGGKN